MRFDSIGWRSPRENAELSTLVQRAREGRNLLHAELHRLDDEQRDALVKRLVVRADEPACNPPLDLTQTADELCETCIEVRGPFDQGFTRRKLRERARIHLHLSHGQHALRSSSDLLALWDEATRREPDIRLFVDEPRWRTAADGVPFTGAKYSALYGARDLDPGNETAEPADIPQLVDGAVNFAARDDLPLEIIALAMSYLLFRIHPFRDGNGHTLRMLCCGLMHAAGYSEPALLAYIDLLHERRLDLCLLSQGVSLGRATTEDHVAFHVNLMLDAQQCVIDALSNY